MRKRMNMDHVRGEFVHLICGLGKRENLLIIFFFVSFSAVGISAENFVSLSGKNLILGKREREREREGEREEK
jgi:hypothetical protein